VDETVSPSPCSPLREGVAETRASASSVRDLLDSRSSGGAPTTGSASRARAQLRGDRTRRPQLVQQIVRRSRRRPTVRYIPLGLFIPQSSSQTPTPDHAPAPPISQPSHYTKSFPPTPPPFLFCPPSTTFLLTPPRNTYLTRSLPNLHSHYPHNNCPLLNRSVEKS